MLGARNTTAGILLALAVTACDDGPLLARDVTPLAGWWAREWPQGGSRLDPLPPQSLSIRPDGRYVIESGTIVSSLQRGFGSLEYGVVRMGRDGLEWHVDSIVRITQRLPEQTRVRSVEVRPIYIEGHPWAGARALVDDDEHLVLFGRNSAGGGPADFAASFRRVRIVNALF
jgi:hypothetical protein